LGSGKVCSLDSKGNIKRFIQYELKRGLDDGALGAMYQRYNGYCDRLNRAIKVKVEGTFTGNQLFATGKSARHKSLHVPNARGMDVVLQTDADKKTKDLELGNFTSTNGRGPPLKPELRPKIAKICKQSCHNFRSPHLQKHQTTSSCLLRR